MPCRHFIKIFFLTALTSTFQHTAQGQLWKQYAQTAAGFSTEENYDSALLYLARVKAILKKDSSATLTYAKNCFALAATWFDLNNYEKAEPLYLEGKSIYNKKPVLKDSVYVLNINKLAQIYTDLLNFEEAEALFLENIQIVERTAGKENLIYASTLNSLGSLYLNTHEFEKAESRYKLVISKAEKLVGKKHLLYATASMNLASVYYMTKRFDKAEPLFLEARELWAEVAGKDHPNYGRVCNNLGMLYSDANQYEKAEPFTLEAKSNWAAAFGKQSIDYANTCLNLGIIYWNLHKIEKAQAEYLEAFTSQYKYYVNRVFNFTSEEEKYYLLRDFYGYSGDLFSFNTLAWSHQQQGAAYDVSLAMRNLILSSTVQTRHSIQASGDKILIGKYDAWMELKEQLAALYSDPGTKVSEEIQALETKANLLEKELTRRSVAFKNQRENTSTGWKEIQESLKTNEAAVEFVDFVFFNGKDWTDSIYYIALLLRPDQKEPVLIQLFEEKQLEEYITTHRSISAFYRGLEGSYDGKYDSRLYDLLWKPLEKYLQGISKVYFAPSGLLNKISFAALPVTRDTVLSERVNLVQLNTTASVVDRVNAFIGSTDKIQLYGGINYLADPVTGTLNKSKPGDNNAEDGPWKYLKGTKTEIDTIELLARRSGIIPKSFSGSTATEASLKAVNGKISPSVLHIATHGFFFNAPDSTETSKGTGNIFKQSENPLMRSGLLFAGAAKTMSGKSVKGREDGVLTAYEVSNLYLPNTKLVVLSACETGLGEIQSEEGVFGLQRAFKMAGVQNLVMSLWKVPDAESAEFMQEFYKGLFNKQPVSEAFDRAQLLMKTKYRDDPYKWAAWVLVR